MSSRVGVLAIQGDYACHMQVFAGLGAEVSEVRTPEDLAQVDRLVIPGGESSTVGKLLERYGTGAAIRQRAAAGMPIWGTCMGMIMLAKRIENRTQYALELLNITVRRNAFGAQVHSFETEVPMAGWEEPLTAVFIRAPIVTEIGASVEVLARYEDKIVAVREGKLLGTSFHPELTDDTRLAAEFLTY